MNTQRFRCRQCGAAGPLFQRPTASGYQMPTRSTSINTMDPHGLFCTLRCAARFGVRAATKYASGL